MAKYDPLRVRLERAGDSLDLGFDEIADLVGGLPSSAYHHSAWWANETSGRHVQAHAWIDAGYRVDDLRLGARRVRFTSLFGGDR